jgi:hypothetical protein
VIEGNVDSVDGGIVADGQTQIANGAGAIGLDQNVFGFEIAMSDGRFTCTRSNKTDQINDLSIDPNK